MAELSAYFNHYPLFTCSGPPPNEPTCTPFRNEGDEGDGIFYDGIPKAGDADGDGVADGLDTCSSVFNPPRPVDGFEQGDADGDGIGDACDRCPLDPGEEICLVPIAKISLAAEGLEVRFRDESSNSPTSWDWQFGDGEFSAEQHPVHTYPEPGSYAVSCTVSNAYGSDSASATVLVAIGDTVRRSGGRRFRP